MIHKCPHCTGHCPKFTVAEKFTLFQIFCSVSFYSCLCMAMNINMQSLSMPCLYQKDKFVCLFYLAVCLKQLSYAFIDFIQGLIVWQLHHTWSGRTQNNWPNSKHAGIALKKSHTDICLVTTYVFCMALHELCIILRPWFWHAQVQTWNPCFNVLNAVVLNCTPVVWYVFLLPVQLYPRNKLI